MNKTLKIVLIIFASLIIVWGIYIMYDSNRLQNTKYGTKPLIILEEEHKTVYDDTASEDKYIGLGYTVKYKYFIKENNKNEIEYFGKSAELKLFDKILIWGWIE